MPNPIGYKTLVSVEMGFLYVQLKLRLENSTQNGNMKKNVLFSPLFLYNLALITHDATKSVNPSIQHDRAQNRPCVCVRWKTVLRHSRYFLSLSYLYYIR